MLNGILGLLFFTCFALAIPIFLLKLRNPEKIFLSASIISAPWFGGIWLGFIKTDLRLTYIFLILTIIFQISASLNINKTRKILFTIIIPVIIFSIWSILSGVQAIDSAVAFGGSFIILINLLYLMVIFLAIKKSNDVDYILKSLFLSLLFTSFLALIQYKFRYFFIGFIDRGFTQFMFWRTRSTFHHANQYGMYQMLILPILFRQIFIVYKNNNLKQMTLYMMLFLLSSFTLYTTSSRGSWLGLAFGIIVTSVIDFIRRDSKKNRRILIRITAVFGILVLIASIRYGPRVYDRFFGSSINIYKQAEHRTILNDEAIRIIKSHPLTGVGISNSNFYVSQIFTHNLYLLIISEVGFVGFFFFIFIMFYFFYEAIKGIRAKSFFVSNVSTGFMATLLGFSLASFPGPDYWVSDQVSGHLWIVAGIIIGLNSYYKMMVLRYKKKRKNEKKAKMIESESINLAL